MLIVHSFSCLISIHTTAQRVSQREKLGRNKGNETPGHTRGLDVASHVVLSRQAVRVKERKSSDRAPASDAGAIPVPPPGHPPGPEAHLWIPAH